MPFYSIVVSCNLSINLPNTPPLSGFEIGSYNKFAQLWANIIISRENFKKTPMLFAVLEKDKET